jgi:hypothetical protein
MRGQSYAPVFRFRRFVATESNDFCNEINPCVNAVLAAVSPAAASRIATDSDDSALAMAAAKLRGADGDCEKPLFFRPGMHFSFGRKPATPIDQALTSSKKHVARRSERRCDGSFANPKCRAATEAAMDMTAAIRNPRAMTRAFIWITNSAAANLPLAAHPCVGHIRLNGAVAEWLKAAVC